MKKTAPLLMTTIAIAGVALSDARRAEACGGCFVPPSPDVSVVTDHRMAFAITAKQTILWDQIRYSGDPREFAWVLPVKPGATIELANDEFFTALDTSSQPIVYAPQTQNTFGCALTGCSEDSASSFSESRGANGGVQVIAQSVVGPYDQVTLRSTDNDALVNWLRSNQFAIPTAIEPTIAAYVREQFDFIALKLRPECGQRSMKPVRVVTPGAAPTLPLRMVAAGVGPKVGITLYVISEGKYQPQNFPHVVIPDERLRWDRYQNKSNYETLSQDLMAQAEGKTWIVEYADKPQTPLSPGWHDPNQIPPKLGQNAGLTSTYYSLCKYWSGNYGRNPNYNPYDPYGGSSTSSSGTINVTPCPEPDAGLKPFDAGSDAAADAGGDAGRDAGEDAGQGDDDDNGQQTSSSSSSSGYSSSSSSSSGGYTPSTNPAQDCAYLDDLDTAFEGIAYENVWVTRMRSILPANALSEGDLVLEPTKRADGRADTDAVSNVHWTPYYSDDDLTDNDVKSNCAGSPRHYHRPYASYTALGIFAAAVSIALARRHRRPKKK
jgi:hypothetical protein